MNSPTIAAVAPGLTQQAGPASKPEGEDGSRFADLLAKQVPGQRDEGDSANPGKPTEPAAEGQASSAGAHASATRDEAAADAEKAAQYETDHLHALPHIALEIATHARDHAARSEVASARVNEQVQPRLSLVEGQAAASSARFTRDGKLASASQHASTEAQAAASQKGSFNAVSGAAANNMAGHQAAASQVSAATRMTSTDTTASRQARAMADARQDAAASRLQVTQQHANQPLRHSSDLTAAIEQSATQQGSTPAAQQAHVAPDTMMPLPGAAALANPFAQASAPAAVHAAAISTPVHHPGWDADVGRQMVTLARDAHNGMQTAELRLDPPDLGPLRISISLNDGMASAIFVSAHASVRQAIESALPQLSQQLAQAGISLGQTHVGDQGQADSMFGNDAGQGRRQGASAGRGSAMNGATPIAQAGPMQRNVAANSLVDTFA